MNEGTVGNSIFNWLAVTSGGPDADGWYWLKSEPKRWYALYPSFWAFAIRNRRLTPHEGLPLEDA